MRPHLLLLLLIAATFGHGQDLKSDVRLNKSISVRLKIASFASMAESLTKQTGVPVSVAPNIADRKITLICKDQPAAEAMEMIAKTFFGEWKAESGGYIFSLPREMISLENRLIAAEDSAMNALLGAEIDRLIHLSDVSKEERFEQKAKIDAEIATLSKLTTEAAKQRLKELAQDNRKIMALDWWEIGKALRAASPAQIAELKQGGTLFASTHAAVGLPLAMSAIPSNARKTVYTKDGEGNLKVGQEPVTAAFAAVRFNVFSRRLEARIMPELGPNSATSQAIALAIMETPEAKSATAEQPLRKRLSQWAGETDPDVFKLRITHPSVEPRPKGYLAAAYSMAEHLEYIADNAGVPVVADAYRLPVSFDSFYRSAATVGDYVRAIYTDNYSNAYMLHGMGYRTESGWLCFRHPSYWRLNQQEVPESWVTPLEAKASWTLEDFAILASRLSAKQSFFLMDAPVLLRFPRQPFQTAMPALRLWGKLNPSQRSAAYENRLQAAQMNSDQYRLYHDALLSFVWTGALNTRFLPALLPGVHLPPDMALFMRDAKNDAPVFISTVVEEIPRIGSGGSFSVENSGPQVESRVVFLFGTSPSDSAMYGLSLIPRSPQKN